MAEDLLDKHLMTGSIPARSVNFWMCIAQMDFPYCVNINFPVFCAIDMGFID